MVSLCMGYSLFEHETLVSGFVDEALSFVVNIMCMYAFVLDFENNNLRVGGRDIIVYPKHIETLIGLINYVAITISQMLRKS